MTHFGKTYALLMLPYQEDTLSPLVDNGLNGDFIKIAYSNILYNWGLLEKRAEVISPVQCPWLV